MAKIFSALGLDPGLNKTGWGLVTLEGNGLKHVANGTIMTNPADDLPIRLTKIYHEIHSVIKEFNPGTVAVEETFVNKNPVATLKLSHARTIALLVPALCGLEVTSYAPNHIKKAVVGAGHAQKEQIHMMVSTLLPGVKINGADAADALAIAICHAHHVSSPILKTGTWS